VKAESRSVCITVNCNVCESAIALQLPVILSCVYMVSINPIIKSRTRLVNHATNPHQEI
jgi:hypothetical protein